MRWRLVIEEFSPSLVHVKGENNPVTDALSRLHLEPTPQSESDDTALEMPSTQKLRSNLDSSNVIQTLA